MKQARASILRLVDATNSLLACVACEDLAAAEGCLRERDAALAALARDGARVPLQSEEREALARVARASGQAESLLTEQQGGLASELRELRGARAALPRGARFGSRTLARA